MVIKTNWHTLTVGQLMVNTEAPMEMVILLLAAIALLPALVANGRGHRPETVALVFVLNFVGIIAAGIGLFALMFHGYVEDSGMEPSNTLPVAIPLLVFGAAMTIAAGRLTRRRYKPPASFRCPECNAHFDDLNDLREHRRTCGDV